MTLKSNITLDASSVFINTSEFAEAMTYSGGGSVRVVADFNARLEGWDITGQATTAVFVLLRSEVASPARYQTITAADGTVWRIEQILANDDDTWVIQVSTDRRVA